MSSENQKYLVLLVGPTAIGKTAYAIPLATAFHSEIVSADSRQFFQELNIGVAKPSTQEMSLVQHHFVGHLPIEKKYSIADFEKDCITFCENYFQQHDVLVMVGGSGMYMDAVCNGLDEMPFIRQETKQKVNELFESNGLEFVQQLLKEKDEAYFNEVDIMNSRRVLRAVEVIIETGNTFSSYRTKHHKKRAFQVIKVGLEIPRDDLYQRINQRVDTMMQQGLLEEVKSLQAYLPNKNLDTIAYRELFEYLDAKISLEEAIALIKQHTRQYAKRQLTWFRKDQEIQWFHPTQIEDCIRFVQQKMKRS